MIIMPRTFSFLFRNVNTSHALASSILEEYASHDIDVIFFQELTQKHIQRTAHIDFPEGEPVIGLPIHPSWHCLPPPALTSQVAIYIHSRIFQCYHFTVDSKIFGHPNIFVMFCYDPSHHTTTIYINLYANPNRDCAASLKNMIPTLLSQLYKLPSVHLIQGDFNLHCHYWDKTSNKNPSLAWDLIRTLHDSQMSLVNDKSIPTFYRANHRPQVLDLIWVNDYIYNWHGCQLLYDIIGPLMDHRTLLLCFGSHEDAMLENQHLLR